MTQMEAFVKERNEALLSLDRKKIERYLKKYGVKPPSNERVFWAGVHKAIIQIPSVPLERKMHSAVWLKEHGFSTRID